MTVKTFGARPGADHSSTEDTYAVFFSSTNYSTANSIRVGSVEEFSVQHAFIRFPSLSSDITGPVSVTSATLSLGSTSTTSGSSPISAYRMLVDSSFAELNWFDRLSAGPVLWTNEGALGSPDSDPTVIGTITPAGTWATYTAYSLTGEGLRALVEGWINGTIPNYGIVLAVNPDGVWDGTLCDFSSAQDPDNDFQRPLLTVDYAEVEGSAAVEGSRRRRTNFRPGDKGTFSFGLGRFFQSRAANASNGIKAALPSSGALVGQLGGVAGTATHSAAAGAHPTSGALTGQLGGVAGSAAHATLHATSGALTGQIGGVGASAVRGIIPPTSRRKGGMWVKGKPPAPKPDAFADSLHRPFTPPAPVADAPEAESVVSPPPVNIFAAPSLAQALAELRIPPKPPSPHAPPRVRPAVEIPADILALLAKLK